MATAGWPENDGSSGDGFEAAQEEWMNRELGLAARSSRPSIPGSTMCFPRSRPKRPRARRRMPRRPPIPNGAAAHRTTTSYDLEAFVAAEITLGGHLAEQLAVAFTEPAQRMIGQYLIDLVDDAGYLPADLGRPPSGSAHRRQDVEAVLAVLQTFDPPGVCARNLSECLAIQLRELNRYDPAMQALVEHLDLLAKRDIAALRKICGVDDEDLADMIGEIRRLDPKPGLKFGSARTQTVVPDVYVRPGPDGGWLSS